MRQIVCLIGPSGSGKSTAGKVLEEYGFHYLSPGSHVRKIKKDILKKMGFGYDLNELIAAIDQTYSKGYNEFIGNLISHCPYENIVLDSLINTNHIGEVFLNVDHVSLLGINAPFEERVKRVANRPYFGNKSLNQVEEIVTKIDQYEMSLGLGNLLLWSDDLIFTNGNLSEFYQRLESFVKRLPASNLTKKLEMLNSTFPRLDTLDIHTETFRLYKEKWL